MRRTGFKRPERASRATRLPAPAPTGMQRGVYARCNETATVVEKRCYVRSDALMAAYRLIPCQHCGRDDGTVCGAHANWSIFGKGGHIKADDNRAASLCAACHVPVLDQGSRLSRAERKAMWWAAHVRTVLELMRQGLWPAKAPVPDITTNPFQEPQTT